MINDVSDTIHYLNTCEVARVQLPSAILHVIQSSCGFIIVRKRSIT